LWGRDLLGTPKLPARRALRHPRLGSSNADAPRGARRRGSTVVGTTVATGNEGARWLDRRDAGADVAAPCRPSSRRPVRPTMKLRYRVPPRGRPGRGAGSTACRGVRPGGTGRRTPGLDAGRTSRTGRGELGISKAASRSSPPRTAPSRGAAPGPPGTEALVARAARCCMAVVDSNRATPRCARIEFTPDVPTVAVPAPDGSGIGRVHPPGRYRGGTAPAGYRPRPRGVRGPRSRPGTRRVAGNPR
jgi:hypothetical protein